MFNWPVSDWVTFLAALGAFLTSIIHAVRSSAKKEQLHQEIQEVKELSQQHEVKAEARAQRRGDSTPPPYDPSRRPPPFV